MHSAWSRIRKANTYALVNSRCKLPIPSRNKSLREPTYKLYTLANPRKNAQSEGGVAAILPLFLFSSLLLCFEESRRYKACIILCIWYSASLVRLYLYTGTDSLFILNREYMQSAPLNHRIMSSINLESPLADGGEWKIGRLLCLLEPINILEFFVTPSARAVLPIKV